METKKCTVCKIEKEKTQFAKHKCTKDGLHSDCRSCASEYRKRNFEKRKEYNKKFIENNVEYYKNYRKEYSIKNKEAISEKAKLRNKNLSKEDREILNAKAREKYNQNEEIRKKKAKYRKENPDIYSNATKKYKDKNKDIIAQKHRDRMKNDPIYAMKRKIRDAIKNSIIKKGYSKIGKTCEILGCNYDFFIQYMEFQFKEGMNWNNITIDHIKPLATAKSIEDVILLNHYTNLQPLTMSENSSKKDKLITKQLRLL